MADPRLLKKQKFALLDALSAHDLNRMNHVLDEHPVLLSQLSPANLAASSACSQDILQPLLDRGWNINATDLRAPNFPGKSILHHVCPNEALLRWCLDHGASVHQDPPVDTSSNPPLLDEVAARGSVTSFKLLCDLGAQSGRRTLHGAVAAAVDCNPAEYDARMAMVRFLIEERGLDVNGLDAETDEIQNQWGTPLNYSVQMQKGDRPEVLRYLLERGADPGVKDRYQGIDAWALAKGKPLLNSALEEWKMARGREG